MKRLYATAAIAAAIPFIVFATAPAKAPIPGPRTETSAATTPVATAEGERTS